MGLVGKQGRDGVASGRERQGDGRNTDNEEPDEGDEPGDTDSIHRTGGVADLHQCGRGEQLIARVARMQAKRTAAIAAQIAGISKGAW